MAAVEGIPYQTGRLLAEGGMGMVYIAWRRLGGFERPYAMKRLRPHLRQDPTARRMFLEEARLAASLRHAHAVSVLDAGEDQDGPFLVMDYIESLNLSRIMGSGETLPLQVVVRALAQVAKALHAAHELRHADGAGGLIHRDISPQNILLGFDGQARLTDFGIAKLIHSESESTSGILKGKLAYMAPEVLRFQKSGVRSDLFALGVVLWECLAGRRLYRCTDELETARRVLEEPPPDLFDEREDAPPALVDLTLRLLAKNPATRPDSAAEVAATLEHVLAQLHLMEGMLDTASWLRARFMPPDIGKPPPSLAPPPKGSRGISRVVWGSAAVVALAATAIAGLLGWFPLQEQTETLVDKPSPPVLGPSVSGPSPSGSKASRADIGEDQADMGAAAVAWGSGEQELVRPAPREVVSDSAGGAAEVAQQQGRLPPPRRRQRNPSANHESGGSQTSRVWHAWD